MRRIRLLPCVIAIAMIVSFAVTSCDNQVQTTTPESNTTTPGSSESTAITTESSSVPTTAVPAVYNLTSLPDIFYTPDFGDVVASTAFYWSPSASYCLFIGHSQNEKQQFIPAAYLYDINRDHLVKLVEGQADADYYLAEPAWSPDEMKVIIPFYDFTDTNLPLRLYDLAKAELKSLPVSGTLPTFSPDGRQLAFTDDEGSINFYDIATGQAVSPSFNLSGYSPVWFVSQQEMLYIAPTGNNPSNLEYGWLSEVRLLNFQSPDTEKTVMPESSYHRIRWLSQDKLALVESGMDDGFYSAILNTVDLSITDLGETRLTLTKTWDQVVNPVVIDYENAVIRQFDQQMKELNAYQASAENVITAISLLPGNQLLGLSLVAAENKCYLSVLSPDGSGNRKIAFYSGDLSVMTAADGSRAACFDQESGRFYILETKELYTKIG
jgi:WD40 repeat protein